MLRRRTMAGGIEYQIGDLIKTPETVGYISRTKRSRDEYTVHIRNMTNFSPDRLPKEEDFQDLRVFRALAYDSTAFYVPEALEHLNIKGRTSIMDLVPRKGEDNLFVYPGSLVLSEGRICVVTSVSHIIYRNDIGPDSLCTYIRCELGEVKANNFVLLEDLEE